MLIFIWATLITAVSPQASAEYRAFELLIENIETGNSRTLISTLDHIQYSGYYPLADSEQVIYLDSWMCWERSDHFKRICPKPTKP